MKKVLVVLSIFIYLNLNAQSVFNAFKLDNVQWNMVSINGIPPISQTKHFYKLCGDTIVRDTMYKKMYYASYDLPYSCCPPGFVYPIPTFSLYGFFRQDSLSKSNYFMPINDTVSSLWYCYNLAIGDTIRAYGSSKLLCSGSLYSSSVGCSVPGSVYPIVLKTDSIDIGDKKFKIYLTDTSHCSTILYSNPGAYLIEGLGHCYGIFNEMQQSFEGTITLSGIAFDTVCVNETVGINKSKLPQNFVRVFPNPTCNSINIEISGNEVQQMQIANVLGLEVMQVTIQSGKAIVDVSDLLGGVYFIRTKSGSVRFIKL